MKIFNKIQSSFFVSFIAAMLSVSQMNAQEMPSVQVQTQNGVLEGVHDADRALDIFLGVPFAQPPVGALRWKAPQPLDDWEGILEAKAFGPGPVQAPVFGDMRFRRPSMSEDCLYLNVWAPADASKHAEKYPVLLYFYGGGCVAGDGSEPRYDGASMAQRGVISVTCNYRLALFGFLAHPELSAESAYHGSGNYGFLDQNAALRWVRDNIEAFGGDPDRITIAGESAGSISVSMHMASPLSRDLIAGAIGQSGAAIKPTMAPVPLATAEEIGKEFFQSLGIENLEEARAMDTDTIFQAYVAKKRFGFPGVIDGYFLEESLVDTFAAGAQSQVPLMLGWTSAEIPGMAFMQGTPYTPENFVAKVKQAYPKDFEQLLELYPHCNEQEVERSATDLAAAGFIVYSTWKWSELHRKHSDAPVYRYQFDKIRPPLKDATLQSGLAGGTVKRQGDAPAAPKPFGASHASEIESVLGNLYLTDEYAWEPVDYEVSNTALGFFSQFVKTGNPNGEGLPTWPAAKGEVPEVMHIDVDSEAKPSEKEAQLEYLDTIFQRD